MARIYLSARYGKRPLMVQYAKALRALDYDVTSSWVYRRQKAEATLTMREARNIAIADLFDVYNSDVIIFFTEDSPGKGGRRFSEDRWNPHI